MEVSKHLTIVEAAASLGLAASTLRVQIRNGALRATKFASIWVIAPEEVERYRAVSRGNHGNRRNRVDEGESSEPAA